MVVLVGGDAVTAHDAGTGQEVWRYGDWNPEKIGHWRVVPSVVAAGELVIACAPKNGPVMAIRPDGTGNVTKTHEAWKTTAFTSDVCVPLYYQNKLFVLDGDGKVLHRVDPATGKPEASVKLSSKPVFRASPTAADGKIYCMNERGEVWVIAAAATGELEVVNQVDLSGDSQVDTRSSIALADGQVFVRTADSCTASAASSVVPGAATRAPPRAT
jgi:outer membrane protein assembly factor BamB